MRILIQNLKTPSKKLLGVLFYILSSLVVVLTAIYFSINKGTDVACSPVGGEIVCSRFRCDTGSPQKTFGGLGACSDGSSPIVIKTWGE